MKTGIFKLSISLFSLAILLTLIVVNLFLEDFLTSKINNFLNKEFRTKSSLRGLDIKFSDLSLTLNDFYVRSPVDFHKANLIEFKNLRMQLEPSLAIKNIVHFNKVTVHDLSLYVSFDNGAFSSRILKPKDISPGLESPKSPKFKFNVIEVSGLKLYLQSDDFFKEIKVPNFQIDNLLVGEEPIPPFLHFTKSLIKVILEEAKLHVKTEVLNELRIKLRKTLLERVGERLKDRISGKLKKILNF